MDIGWPEVLIVVLVVLLLFGGRKLPEIARGTGRALRIFKAETKGLADDDKSDDDKKTDSQRDLEARQAAEREALEARQAAERRDDPTV